MYNLIFSDDAKKGILRLKCNEPNAYKKLIILLEELRMHPLTGLGKPERLKYNLTGMWSRRITEKHRLVYEVKDAIYIVEIVRAYGHYDDN